MYLTGLVSKARKGRQDLKPRRQKLKDELGEEISNLNLDSIQFLHTCLSTLKARTSFEGSLLTIGASNDDESIDAWWILVDHQ